MNDFGPAGAHIYVVLGISWDYDEHEEIDSVWSSYDDALAHARKLWDSAMIRGGPIIETQGGSYPNVIASGSTKDGLDGWVIEKWTIQPASTEQSWGRGGVPSEKGE